MSTPQTLSVAEQTKRLEGYYGSKGIIFGHPGCGKTRLLASILAIQSMLPVLFISFEAGISSIKSKCRIIKEQDLGNPVGDMLNVIEVESWVHLQSIYNWLLKNPNVYRAIEIDTLSEFGLLCLYTNAGFKTDTPFVKTSIEIQQYGYTNTQFNLMLRAFRKLPCTVIMTAQVEADPIEDKGSVTYLMPELPGKLGVQSLKVFDFNCYLESNGATRKLYLSTQGRILSKFRTERDDLPQAITDPTLLKLFTQ